MHLFSLPFTLIALKNPVQAIALRSHQIRKQSISVHKCSPSNQNGNIYTEIKLHTAALLTYKMTFTGN